MLWAYIHAVTVIIMDTLCHVTATTILIELATPIHQHH